VTPLARRRANRPDRGEDLGRPERAVRSDRPGLHTGGREVRAGRVPRDEAVAVVVQGDLRPVADAESGDRAEDAGAGDRAGEDLRAVGSPAAPGQHRVAVQSPASSSKMLSSWAAGETLAYLTSVAAPAMARRAEPPPDVRGVPRPARSSPSRRRGRSRRGRRPRPAGPRRRRGSAPGRASCPRRNAPSGESVWTGPSTPSAAAVRAFTTGWSRSGRSRLYVR
jgi:hypothetical protein